MFFQSMEIHEWQQFANVQIQFHERLTVLTGANGSGKTTILNLLARHFDWKIPSLATPKADRSNGIVKFLSRLWNGENKSERPTFGNITYSNHMIANLNVPNSNFAQYHIHIDNLQAIKCFFIPSHRSIYRYQALGNIPTTRKSKKTAFSEVNNLAKGRYQNGREDQSASMFMKNTLIGWAIQGYGVKTSTSKTIMPPDLEQVENFEGFQGVLRNILPKSLGFRELEIRNMEVVFVCNDGRDEFLLETASGGITAIIDMAWQIYMYSTKEDAECTVIIDEIENHLHPSMQRQILPDLLKSFPNARFIVSTHSPLVVGSVRDSYTYALQYNELNKICSHKLDFDKKAKTAAEILDEVLGVSVTMPVWAEDQLESILERYSSEGLTEESFKQLKGELGGIGLEHMLPNAIANLLERLNDPN
ncbi:AAA family ATPase [Thalassospira marina]|uniref:OLD family endonuclease n=1 Tax=Thalassospira marina TaxID=2048283 RepID=A0A2N3KU30_9PROT|nr:ATP-binding protein [Thalassospira marina]PKR54052.1 OLD family endonuclease [Thalassospira marina]